jgi:dTDP-4-amino-4,6-dideoxygalactose transaminase
MEGVRQGRHGWYEILDTFESEFAAFAGTRYALAHANGTATLHAAMFAAGVKAGDEVIVPSYTWHATISPILHCGGTPVYCDIDPATFTADPADIERKVTPRTRAIVVTHIFGNPARMDEIVAIGQRHGVAVIEDASHAHGATYDGRAVGSLGQAGCFSLQASKALAAVEGGMATTDDGDLFDRMLVLGHYGRIGKKRTGERYRDLHDIGLGVKYRANPLGMAMARVQLRRLPEVNARRTAWFAHLNRALADLEGFRPQAVYPKAVRGGLLLYTGAFDPAVTGVPTPAILKALIAEGVDCQPGITPFGYGRMHLEPVFSTFPFEGFGGHWGSAGGDGRRPFLPGSLPRSEWLAANAFWMNTLVDPEPELVEQVAVAFHKVLRNADRLV